MNAFEKKIDDAFVCVCVYIAMLLDFSRRSPKMAIILVLAGFCAICVAHLSMYDSSKLFFGLAALIAAVIALTLIVFYGKDGVSELEYVDHKSIPKVDPWIWT